MWILLLILSTTFQTQQPPDQLHLIEYGEGKRKWINTTHLLALRSRNVHFFDVTNHPQSPSSPLPRKISPTQPEYPHELRQVQLVERLKLGLSADFLYEFIHDVSENFETRYVHSTPGLQSVEWIEGRYEEVISALPDERKALVQKEVVHHKGLDMPSLIYSIEGAHMDDMPSKGRAPGADDDGAGIAVVFALFKLLAESDFVPARTLHFHSYSAEEIGLVGSQDIAEQFHNDDLIVHAMINLDMIAFHNPSVQEYWASLVTDYTDHQLNKYLEMTIVGYTDMTYTHEKCGYACSDHASWNKYGFPATYPFESEENWYYHTVNDKIDYVDMIQVTEFARFCLGAMVELSAEI